MALRYLLYNFTTGAVVNPNLRMGKGSDSVERNIIDGGSASVELDWFHLPLETRNTWQTYFKPMARGIALVDDSQPITSRSAVLFAGVINKVAVTTGSGFIRAQVASMNEYLAAIHDMEVWSEEWMEPEPTTADGGEATEPTYKAPSWNAMLRSMAARAFAVSGPTGAPTPPTGIIRNGLAISTSGDREVPIKYDGTTFLAILEAIRDGLSGNGIEFQFVPYFATEARDRIVFDFETGTEAAPHLNETAINIELSAKDHKITEHSVTIDSTEMFNKVLLAYTTPPETEGAQGDKKIAAAWDGTDVDLPLLTKFVNTSAELSAADLEKLKAAYIKDGKTGGQEVSFAVAGAWDKSEWIGNLGKIVHFTGLPETISAGSSMSVRCVGVEFNSQYSTVKASFMQLASKYPTTAKKQKAKKAFKPLEKVGWSKYGPQGKLIDPDTGQEYVTPGAPTGPTTPTAPTEDNWTNAEEHNIGSSYGTEGRTQDAPWPKVNAANSFGDFREGVIPFTTWQGVVPMDPRTMCQHEGNRLFVLDRKVDGWGSKFLSTGAVTEYNGGIADVATGKKKTPHTPIYVSSTYMAQDGTVGPVKHVGTLPAAMVEAAMPEYGDGGFPSGSTVWVQTSYWLTTWYVAGRLYIGLGAVTIATLDGELTTYYYNGKITIFSSKIESNGALADDWRVEPWTFNDDVLPDTEHIARYGKTVIFGAGKPILQQKVVSLTAEQIKTTLGKRGTRSMSANANYSEKAWITNNGDSKRSGHLLVSPHGLTGYSPIGIAAPWPTPAVNAPAATLREPAVSPLYYTNSGGAPGWKTNWSKDFSVADSELKPFSSVKFDDGDGFSSAYGKVSSDEKWSASLFRPVALNGMLAHGHIRTANNNYGTFVDNSAGRWRQVKVSPDRVDENPAWVKGVTPSYDLFSLHSVVLGTPFGSTSEGYNSGLLKKMPDSELYAYKDNTASPYNMFIAGDYVPDLPSEGDLVRPVHLTNTTKWSSATQSRVFSYNGRLFAFNIGGKTGSGTRICWRSMKASEV